MEKEIITASRIRGYLNRLLHTARDENWDDRQLEKTRDEGARVRRREAVFDGESDAGTRLSSSD